MSKYIRYTQSEHPSTLISLAIDAHKNSVDHGFWDSYTALVKLALVTSEIGEAVEAARKNDWENLGEELADICIRVFDLAEGFGINIQSEIISKMIYNKGREHMHGKMA